MTYLDDLNPMQKEAVEATEGPVLVIAGAGAGKTKTITHRIYHLIKKGVNPASILAITFTNKAAKEMRERVVNMMRGDAELKDAVEAGGVPILCTYHSLGVRILRENAERLGIPRQFAIYDRSDSRAALKAAVKAAGYDPKEHPPQKAGALISREKNKGVVQAEYAETVEEDNPIGQFVSSVWREYNRILAEDRALDFDDLLLRTYRLLEENAEVRAVYQKRWRYLHVDEYQDTNRIQYLITKMLVGDAQNPPSHEATGGYNICAVADADQTIYSWRGSEIKNVLRFEKEFAGAHVVRLEENYRSTQTILTVANRVIEKNRYRIPKELFTKNGKGEPIVLTTAFSENDEARRVANRAKESIKNGTPPGEIAILFRANFQSRVLEEAMLKENIPYQLLGTKFFERKEVKDVMAFVRAALNHTEGSAEWFAGAAGDIRRVINVPPRGVGKVTIEKVLAGREADLPARTRQKITDFRALLAKLKSMANTDTPAELVRAVIQKSGMEDALKAEGEEGLERLENVRELVTLAQKYTPAAGMSSRVERGIPQSQNPNLLAVERLLEEAALASDQDEMTDPQNAVKLLTVHAAKGLEFDHVFITGLETGLFPHQKVTEESVSEEEAEEERRLFYVALTRARKKVFLSCAQMRTIYGSRQVCIPSEFISDIDEEFLDADISDDVPHTGLLDDRTMFKIDF